MASTCAQLPTLTVIITRPPLPRRWRNPHLSCLWPSGVRLSHTLPKVLDVFCLFGLCFCCRFQLPVANSTGNVGLTPAVAALFGRPTWSYWLCFVGPATPTPHHWVDPFFFFFGWWAVQHKATNFSLTFASYDNDGDDHYNDDGNGDGLCRMPHIS